MVKIGVSTSLVFLTLLKFLKGQSCPSDHYSFLGKCCPKCPAGTFVKTDCTQNNGTICLPCKEGTFTSNWNSQRECTRCRKRNCPSSLKLTQTCSSTTDYKCSCESPYKYHDLGTDSCFDCTVCTPGYYPKDPCTKNTMCTICPENHFSNRTNNYHQECIQCTTCRLYKSACNRTHDAQCEDDIPTTGTTTSRNERNSQDTTISTTKLDSPKRFDMTLIPVIVGVILFVFPVTFFILIWKKKRRFCQRTSTRFPIIHESKYQTLNTRGALLMNQPSQLLFELHEKLNPDEPKANWKTLAAELGFSYIQIANFEVDRFHSAERMLASWQTRSFATIDKLHEALMKIRREDVATFLAENVEEKNESEV